MKTTRKLLWPALLAAMALGPAGCKRHKSVQVQDTIEEGPRMASTLRMGDPKVETQLVSGFYGIEGNAWRWTGKQFIVVLKTPFGAAQRGGTLTFNLAVPQAVIENLKNISLAASVDGSPLAPETFTQPGPAVFKRDIPASLLGGDTVKVEFQLDKSYSPGGADTRELGVVATSIALEPK
jgi:hypothetical protein